MLTNHNIFHVELKLATNVRLLSDEQLSFLILCMTRGVKAAARLLWRRPNSPRAKGLSSWNPLVRSRLVRRMWYVGSDNMYLMCMASLKPPKADLKEFIVKKGSMHLVLLLHHCEWVYMSDYNPRDLLLGPKLHKRGKTIGGAEDAYASMPWCLMMPNGPSTI